MHPETVATCFGVGYFSEDKYKFQLDLRFRPDVHSALWCTFKTAALWLGNTRTGSGWWGGGEGAEKMLTYCLTNIWFLNMLS